MSLHQTFNKTTKAELQKKLGKKNVHEVPVVQKVVVAMGIGSLASRKGVKEFTDLEQNMEAITGQKAQMILSKKDISNFKLRSGMPSMLRTTLRGAKAHDFIERMTTLVFPRVRDFMGVSGRKFDGKGNYSIGFKTQSVFAEIKPEEVKTPMGVQVTIVTSADTNEDAKALLQSLGIIFENLQPKE